MTFEQLRQQADHVRPIPLKTVLLAIGAEPDRYDKNKWHTPNGTLSVTGTKFFNWNQDKGGGGAIDLTMHLNNLDFKTAVTWLWHHFPGPLPAPQPTPPSKSALRLPIPDTRNISAVRRYLLDERRLPSSLLDPLIESGTLYADTHANAVFLLLGKKNRPTGAELRGTTDRPWRAMAKGSNKNIGYFSVHPIDYQTIILCESAIDALSCFVLHPSYCCISTSGARANPNWLAHLVNKSYCLYCGFDADPTGETMAQSMLALYPAIKRLRPSKHDWNDTLKSQS
jgi:hypothetical protein